MNANPEKETMMLGGICMLLSGLCVAAALYAPITSGINTDNIFWSMAALGLAAVFAAPVILSFLGSGMLKDLLQSASASATAEGAHAAHSHKIYFMVWGGLLFLTIVEILLIFPQLSTKVMLTILVGLSLIKSVLIMWYFMHLKFEKMSLKLTLIPITVVLILLFAVFFPDGLRSLNLRAYRDAPVSEKIKAEEGNKP